MEPTDPGWGSVVSFDGEGRSRVLTSGAKTPEEFVSAVRKRQDEHRSGSAAFG